MLQRLLLIVAIAGAIGSERERHGRAAGFRTHILVGLGSCIVMLTGLHLMETMAAGSPVDPTRMASQVVSGIGFLGAGTIIRSGAAIRGLTTAASLWAVGGLGLAVGAGFIWGALIAGALVVVVLFGFSGLERSMRKEQHRTLIIETAGSGRELVKIRSLLAEHDVEIHDLDAEETGQPDRVRLAFHVKVPSQKSQEDILAKLRQLERTVTAHWV